MIPAQIVTLQRLFPFDEEGDISGYMLSSSVEVTGSGIKIWASGETIHSAQARLEAYRKLLIYALEGK